MGNPITIQAVTDVVPVFRNVVPHGIYLLKAVEKLNKKSMAIFVKRVSLISRYVYFNGVRM